MILGRARPHHRRRIAPARRRSPAGLKIRRVWRASRAPRPAPGLAGNRSQCPYFGSCPGFFVGDATLEQQRLLADSGCPAREVIDHMVGRLEKTDIKDALLAGGAPKTENPALQVSL